MCPGPPPRPPPTQTKKNGGLFGRGFSLHTTIGPQADGECRNAAILALGSASTRPEKDGVDGPSFAKDTHEGTAKHLQCALTPPHEDASCKRDRKNEAFRCNREPPPKASVCK